MRSEGGGVWREAYCFSSAWSSVSSTSVLRGGVIQSGTTISYSEHAKSQRKRGLPPIQKIGVFFWGDAPVGVQGCGWQRLGTGHSLVFVQQYVAWCVARSSAGACRGRPSRLLYHRGVFMFHSLDSSLAVSIPSTRHHPSILSCRRENYHEPERRWYFPKLFACSEGEIRDLKTHPFLRDLPENGHVSASYLRP